MKITDVCTRYLRLPEVSVSGDNLQDILIVEVHTDAGITGVGEVHTNPLAARAIIETRGYHSTSRGLKELLIGEDPRDIGRLWDRMYAQTQSYGRRGLAVNAISGIDIALWDILGKSLNTPISRLFGAMRRDQVPAYASDLTPPTPEATAELAVRHTEAGFKGVKVGWGKLGSDLRADSHRIRLVREAVGPEVAVMVDLGQPVPFDDALWLAEAYSEYNVYFLEEPLSPDDMPGWAELVAKSPTPIATGEKETTRFGFAELMDRGRLRIIQPDVARAGGLTECLRIAVMAEARGVRIIPHCWSSDILVAATLHLISALNDCPFLEFNVMNQPLRTSLSKEPIQPSCGIVKVPDGPGLGIEINEDLVRRLTVE